MPGTPSIRLRPRHASYQNQWRAMFVQNCRVNWNERLRYGQPAERQAAEVYQPVGCAQCGTEIGVLDADEVYHFFNVIPSYG